MQTPNPKTMARILRDALAERHVKLSHSASLELVAKQLGYNDWNVVVAQLKADKTRTNPTSHGSEDGDRLPDGWFASGRSDLFRYDLLAGAGPEDGSALLIENRTLRESTETIKPGDFLTVMQRISARQYRGKLVTLRAQIRCTNATGSGRIWISARGHGRDPLEFDNLGLDRGSDGAVTGTTGWVSRSVTIGIPDAAVYIAFGILFGSGTGSFRAADLSFGLAEEDERPKELPDKPYNLDLA